MANGRYQLIFSADEPHGIIREIEKSRALSKAPLMVESTEPFLIDVIKDGLKLHECNSRTDNRSKILKEDMLGVYKSVLMDNYGVIDGISGNISYYKYICIGSNLDCIT